MDEQVLLFINNFKKPFVENMEYMFMNGNCYWFSKILQIQFGGVIYFDKEKIHFACRIDDTLYDIFGKINHISEWMKWDTFKLAEPSTANQIQEQCIMLTTKKERLYYEEVNLL